MPPSITHHSAPTQLLTLQEATAHGYGAYSTLRKYIAQGQLPAVKIGARVKVSVESLELLATPVPARLTKLAAVDSAIHKLASSLPDLTDQQTKRLALILARTPTSAGSSVEA